MNDEFLKDPYEFVRNMSRYTAPQSDISKNIVGQVELVRQYLIATGKYKAVWETFLNEFEKVAVQNNLDGTRLRKR